MQPAARRKGSARAEKTKRIGRGNPYVREQEWHKDSWSASANVSERGRGTGVEVTTGVEVRAGVELPD